MITDKLLMFSEAQAVTNTAASTDVIDLGPIDGNPQSRRAREVLDEANRESEQAIQDSSLFDVAVACFLRG